MENMPAPTAVPAMIIAPPSTEGRESFWMVSADIFAPDWPRRPWILLY
jgi:hypothetical protein